ncbi:MAG: DUF1854 domain-containing protein [Clostridia bacterium]|nr:DUF1854 domain-containing protein [Clostridia bacterium]
MSAKRSSPQTLSDIVSVTYLNRDNCSFTEKNGFLGLRATIDKRKVSLWEQHRHEDKSTAGDTEELVLDRIFLSRAFPFEKPFEYISVFDGNKHEIGFIRSLTEDFDKADCERLMRELEESYYCPVIRRILSVKSQRGISYWQVECDFGESSFSLRDVYVDMRKIEGKNGELRLLLTDVYGNRYEIPDANALDRQSYRRIELYL